MCVDIQCVDIQCVDIQCVDVEQEELDSRLVLQRAESNLQEENGAKWGETGESSDVRFAFLLID
jgi:hypothetical protein